MSGIFSDETDEDSYGSCEQCNTSSSSVVSYDARYIYRLQQASKHLALAESHFYHNKVPLLGKLEKRCVSLSMDLISANETVFSYKLDDQVVMDNLMWTLRFAPFGQRNQYMMELRVQSEWREEDNWHAEVRLKVTLGGQVLPPLAKFNHPVRFSAQSPSLLVFIVDAATVRAWPSGVVQVDIYPQDLVGVHIAPLFSSKSDPSDVGIRVKKGSAQRTFYVNRRWIENQSEYFDELLNGKFAHGTEEVEINDVAPRDFLTMLRAMERFVESEMFHPDKIANLLKMIDMFQAGHLAHTVGAALEDTTMLDLRTKLIMADKYLPWPIVQRVLDLCEPFDVRRSNIFDDLTLRLQEEVVHRTSNHFPSAMTNVAKGSGPPSPVPYDRSKMSPSQLSSLSNGRYLSASPSLSYQSYQSAYQYPQHSTSYQSFDR